MWHDHQFSQKNKTSKIAVEVKVGGNRKERLQKVHKDWIGNIGVLHNIGGVRNSLSTMTHIELL